MLRLVLILILIVFVARAFWRVVDGIMQGLSGQSARQVPTRGVPMVRDPVCGTYVVGDRAITIADGARRVAFCSTDCRDKYLAAAKRGGRTA